MNCFNSLQLDLKSDSRSIQLDQMLHDGTRLYASISQELQSLQYLGHNQIPKMLNYQNNGFTLEYFLDCYYGTITTGNRSQNDEFGQMNLMHYLKQC